MNILAEGGSIKQPWVGEGNTRSEIPLSKAHESIKSVQKSVRKDLELRWVTNLSEERKRFYLIETQLDPHTTILSFCDDKYFPSSWKDEGYGFLSKDFKSFYGQYRQHTQGEMNHEPTYECSRCPTTQTLSCGGSSTSKGSHPWPSWSGSTWLCLQLWVSWGILEKCGSCKAWLVGSSSGRHLDWRNVV